MRPHGKGKKISGCLVQNIISQPAVPSPGERGWPWIPSTSRGMGIALPSSCHPDPAPCPGTCPLSIPRASPRWAGLP